MYIFKKKLTKQSYLSRLFMYQDDLNCV